MISPVAAVDVSCCYDSNIVLSFGFAAIRNKGRKTYFKVLTISLRDRPYNTCRNASIYRIYV